MRHLFAEWKTLKEKLKGKSIFIFTDYDGTLAPIAQTPGKAVIPQETKKILTALTEQPGCMVAVISGRALKDIRSLVGLNNIIYAGNHGFELAGPKIKFCNAIPARYRKIIERIKSTLRDKLASVKGVLIEDKGLSLSLHYRRVDRKNVPLVKAIFHETIIIPRVKGQIKITFGKKVLEVRLPGKWDKGKAVLWLLARAQFAAGGRPLVPIYLGDDTTDEDGFAALSNKGLTVFVGTPRASRAQYYLKNTREVKKFLKNIIALRKDKKYV